MQNPGSTSAKRFPINALRVMVLLPGACVEGALAVLLPWTVTSTLLASPWLGAASAGLVAAPIIGTMAAPSLDMRIGHRAMTVISAVVVVAALAAAVVCWIWTYTLLAYSLVLLAIAADAISDLGFASRVPLLARLSARNLESFSASNWLCSIGGAAAGSLMAGWAVAADFLVELVFVLVMLSLIVAIGLGLLLPRQRQRRKTHAPIRSTLLQSQFWTPSAKKVAVIVALLVFVGGPLDNLLLPAHLASRGLPASTFGEMIAATGLGLALGLWKVQSSAQANDAQRHNWERRGTTQHHWITLGLLGIAGQLALMLWLPPQWSLLLGLFLCATLFAPLLPILEAAILRAALPAQRTLMLAALSTVIGLADFFGTVIIGALTSSSGSSIALFVCLATICTAALAYRFWAISLTI
jgi:MFS family permease